MYLQSYAIAFLTTMAEMSGFWHLVRAVPPMVHVSKWHTAPFGDEYEGWSVAGGRAVAPGGAGSDGGSSGLATAAVAHARPLRRSKPMRSTLRTGILPTLLSPTRVGIEMRRALHLRVRWLIPRFPMGPQSGSHHAHVSASLPAIPSSGISPTRF